jgi:hypothetical protein
LWLDVRLPSDRYCGCVECCDVQIKSALLTILLQTPQKVVSQV